MRRQGSRRTPDTTISDLDNSPQWCCLQARHLTTEFASAVVRAPERMHVIESRSRCNGTVTDLMMDDVSHIAERHRRIQDEWCSVS